MTENRDAAWRAERIEQLATTYKNHPWFKDETIENCRIMAEAVLSDLARKKEPREITSSTYERAQKRLSKQFNDWFSKGR